MDGHRAGPRCEAVLFDVFGTLVDYEPDRRRLAYPQSRSLLRSWGHEMAAAAFVEEWDAASVELEARSASSLEEFTMLDAATAFSDAAGLSLEEDRCRTLATTLVREWQRHLHPIAGVSQLIHRLSNRFRIGVVSNTHDEAMVPALLHSMGVAQCVEVVVLSVDHGLRKPHRSIYDEALRRLGVDAEKVVSCPGRTRRRARSCPLVRGQRAAGRSRPGG